MKTLKNIAIITVVSLAIMGCDTRRLDSLNDVPAISFIVDGEELGEIEDSVKISIKSDKQTYTATIGLFDNNGDLRSLTYEVLTGDVVITQNGTELSGVVDITGNNGEIQVVFAPQSTGIHVIKFVLTDSFGESVSGEVSLNAFINVAPVANWELEKIGVVDDREYKIDASASYDPDASLGGGLRVWEYTINGIARTLDNQDDNPTEFKHIFGAAGNYEIRVRVQDSDGTWSEYLDDVVSIN